MFSLFGKRSVRNIAVVDVNSTTVGAAYATYSGVAAPRIVYAQIIPVEPYGKDAPGMLRALDALAKDMTHNGAPLLRKTTGTGEVERAVLLIGSPWQTSSLSVKVIEDEKPFLFTKAMLAEASPALRARVMGTLLNGYEAKDPVGKRAKRAEISVLASTIDPEVERLARRAVRGIAGAAPISLVSFAETAPEVLKDYFPHERDFLALRIGLETTEIAFVKQEHLAGLVCASAGSAAFYQAAEDSGLSAGGVVEGIIDRPKSERLQKRFEDAERAWVMTMREAFLKVASEGALPRTLFLFGDERMLPLWKRLLDAPELHALWLSDEPLSVIPLGRGSLAASLQRLDERLPSDAMLDLLCLFSRGSLR
jgi:hypothetical protein